MLLRNETIDLPTDQLIVCLRKNTSKFLPYLLVHNNWSLKQIEDQPSLTNEAWNMIPEIADKSYDRVRVYKLHRLSHPIRIINYFLLITIISNYIVET